MGNPDAKAVKEVEPNFKPKDDYYKESPNKFKAKKKDEVDELDDVEKAWKPWKQWHDEQEAKKKGKNEDVKVKLKEEDDYNEEHPNPKSKQAGKTVKKDDKLNKVQYKSMKKAFEEFKKSGIQGVTDEEVDEMTPKQYAQHKAMTDSERMDEARWKASEKRKKKSNKK